MPLELNPLEISSLNPGSQVEGSTIRKLLGHYIQEDNVQVHLEHGSAPELIHTLNEIKTDHAAAGKKHLIVIQVNSLDKGFHPGDQSHYVGIVIDKTAGAGAAGGQYRIQYIDPMSHPINPGVEEIIRTSLEVDGSISIDPYEGGVQPAIISEDNSIVGNDVDCGVMLTYLMTKAAYNKDLPSLPAVMDKVTDSRLIGEGLRIIFLEDKGKELATSTNLPDLSLSDIKARAIEIGVSITSYAGKGATIAALPSGKIEDSILRHSTALITRESRNPDPISRRLDSIARLITGSDICAAVAFDGDKILFANNNNIVSSIAKDIFSFLSEIANKNLTLKQIEGDPTLREGMSALVERAGKEFASGQRDRDKVAYYKTKIAKDMAKVVSSLAIDGDEKRKFPKEMREAFKRGFTEDSPGIDFVPGRKVLIKDKSTGKEKDTLVTIHAEMAILDRVITPDTINVTDKEVVAGKKPFYVGLTMLCCRSCRNAVVAFNEVSSERVKATKDVSSPVIVEDISFQTIGVRGQHLQQFPWGPPEFFERNHDIKTKYQEIVSSQQRKISIVPGIPLFAKESDSDPEIRSSSGVSVETLRKALEDAIAAQAMAPAPAPAPTTKSFKGADKGKRL